MLDGGEGNTSLTSLHLGVNNAHLLKLDGLGRIVIDPAKDKLIAVARAVIDAARHSQLVRYPRVPAQKYASERE